MGSPLTPPGSPDQLRERARLLRQLARRLENSSLHDLLPLTGGDTWIGPRAFDCAADIHRLSARFALVSADLRSSAHLLELQAAAVPVVGVPR